MFFWSGCQAGVGGWNLAQVSSIKPGDAFNLHLKESRVQPESVPKGCSGTERRVPSCRGTQHPGDPSLQPPGGHRHSDQGVCLGGSLWQRRSSLIHRVVEGE